MTECVKIRCDDCKFVDNCVDYGWDGCRKFTPTPSEPMTNEEYIRSCSAEELAGIIYEWHTKGYTKGEIGFPLKSIMEVVEWLKEKHDG